jgi:hypothetical protein
MKIIDLTGKKFGRLTAIKVATGTKKRSWECICDCGGKSVVDTDRLNNGRSRSCGCIQREYARARATDFPIRKQVKK